jgi:hypothetical protein
MIRFTSGLFIILHGLVHLLYFGHSAGYFELADGLTWPDGAWTFSKFLGQGAVRSLASSALILTALLLAAGGLGVWLRQAWWRPLVLGGAAFSSLLYLLFWNGAFRRLPNQGLIALLINAAIRIAVYMMQQPSSEI